MAKNLLVKQFNAGNCYSYILSSQNEAVIIDPHISLLEQYTAHLKRNNLGLKYIIDTHTHADHFSLAAVLKNNFKVPVMMHDKAISEVAGRRLNEGDNIAFGVKSFKVIYTPGHTDDAISIYGEGMLFTGDALLIGSVGRTDFQNGSPKSMFDTLSKLKALSDNTTIFPGHDYNGRKSSTILKEKENNPYLKEKSKDEFIRKAGGKVLPKPFNIDNIIRVNQLGQAAILKMIAPDEAKELAGKEGKVKFLDVRSALEFSGMHIKGSINIPVDTLQSRIKDINADNSSYIVLCRTGNRSLMAADMLIHSGIHSVKVMDGGITRWRKERLGIVKGKSAVSLERQVRIGAASLILFGIIMSHFVNKGYIWVSLWVACGLLFAGITDNCLMGMLLMKLPYNKKQYKPKTGGGTCSIS